MSLDGQFWFMVALLAVLLGVAVLRGGAEVAREGLSGGGALLLRYLPVIAVSFLAAGIAQALIPTAWVESALGRESGLRGILIGTVAGVVTPAGPFVSMPIAAVLLKAGAALPAVVAFITAWSLLALHRLVAFEIPILGGKFAAIRYGVSLLLPILAGLLTRALVRG